MLGATGPIPERKEGSLYLSQPLAEADSEPQPDQGTGVDTGSEYRISHQVVRSQFILDEVKQVSAEAQSSPAYVGQASNEAESVVTASEIQPEATPPGGPYAVTWPELLDKKLGVLTNPSTLPLLIISASVILVVVLFLQDNGAGRLENVQDLIDFMPKAACCLTFGLFIAGVIYACAKSLSALTRAIGAGTCLLVIAAIWVSVGRWAQDSSQATPSPATSPTPGKKAADP